MLCRWAIRLLSTSCKLVSIKQKAPTKRASLCQFANIQASQSLFPCCLLTTWKCVPLVDLLNALLWAGQNGLPPTPNTLHLGCSYHLHSSHHFLSTWCAIMLKKDYAIFSPIYPLISFFKYSNKQKTAF